MCSSYLLFFCLSLSAASQQLRHVKDDYEEDSTPVENTTDNSTSDPTTWTEPVCVPSCQAAQATDITQNSITVQELNCCNYTDYTLKFKAISQERAKGCGCEFRTTKIIGNCKWKISGLCSNIEYLVQLEAYRSLKINCTTGTDQTLKTKPDAPTKIIWEKFKMRNATAVDLEWSEPSCLNGDKLIYEVLHWISGTTIPKIGNTTTNLRMTIGSLSPKRTYIFLVIAENYKNRNLRSFSDLKQVKTEPAKPSAPQNFRSKVVSSTKINLTWNPPKELGGPSVDGYQIAYGLDGSALNTKEEVAGRTLRFEITGLKPWKTYWFTITAYHSQDPDQKLFGQTSDMINGTTHPAEPSEPRNLVPSLITSNQVTLTWDEPKIKNGNISGYLVMWNSLTDQSSSNEDTTGDLTYTLQDLLPWKEYNFSVSAFNLLEGRPLLGPAVHHMVTTLPSEPSAPTNVTAVAVNSSAIQLQWGRPEEPNGAIDHYQILCFSTLENITLTHGKVEDELGSLVVSDLQAWTDYTCHIWAVVNLNVNETLPGNYSQVTIRTRQDKPSAPTNLEVADRMSTEISLTWEEPEHLNGPLDGFVVSWFPVTSSAITEDRVVNVTSVTVSGLLPWKEYNFSVLAFNNHYDQEKGSLEGPSVTVVGLTRPSKPGGPPEQMKITSVEARSLGVAWMVPNESNGPIDGFTVSLFWTKDDTFLWSNTTVLPATNFSNLEPFQTYIVEVCAYNLDEEKILNGPCAKVSQNTSVDAPSAPTGLMCNVGGANNLNVLWYKPDQLNGPLDGYILEWRKLGDNTPDNWQDRNCTDLKSPGWKEVIDGLDPYSNYKFRVTAFNYLWNDEDGTTLPLFGASANITCRTDAAAPSAPKLEIDGVTSNSVELTWESPEMWNGPSDGYELMWRLKECRVDSCDDAAPLVLSSGKDRAVIADLLPWSNYTFGLVAFNHDKDNKTRLISSKSLQETRTNAGVPAYPEKNLTQLEAFNQQIQFLFPKILFHEIQGPILRYAVIVAGLDNTANISLYERRQGQGSENLGTWSQAKNDNPMPPYQASPVAWNPYNNAYDPFQCQDHVSEDSNDVIGKKCTIGAENECNTTALPYCNGPLHSGKYYAVKIRGFTDGGWSETHPLSVYVESSKRQTSSSTGVAVGLSLTFIFLLLAALVGAVFIKKKGLWPQKTTTTTPSNHDNLITPMTPIPAKRTGTCILVSDFSKHVAEMLSDSGLKFSQEFEELKAASPELPFLVANLPGNKPKNRWANILPFDHSRVKLRPISDDQETDYINASYIPGNTSRREYIATQGPLPSTKDDFWRMIWEQNVSMVVMLTLCVERGKPKCEQYWRDDWEPHYHGDDCIKVVKISESILSAYTIRIFDIQMGGNQRSVKHMHFTKWPDFGCPENPEILINFVRAVRDHLPHSRPAPILVHCSAGVGRTGTFMAVDRLMQQVRDKSEYLDVYRMVLEMRDHRCSMVQTEDQYIYIHECVREIIRDEEERTQTPVPNGFEIYSNLNFNQGEEK